MPMRVASVMIETPSNTHRMTKARSGEPAGTLPRSSGRSRRRGPATVYAATLSVGLLLVLLILSAPLLVANGYAIAGTIVYQAFVPVCHQIPDRSIRVAGLPLAVCARCAGVYGGFVLGLLIYPVSFDSGKMPGRVWLLLAFVPMAVDALAGAMGLVQNTILSRTATGVLAGAALAFYIFPGLVLIVGSGTAKASRRSSA